MSDHVAISQNARFSGAAALDAEYEHPPGASIARLLRDALATRRWEVSDIENWRDSGWLITCCRTESKMELVIAKVGPGDEWLLQIAPSYVPGLVGKLLKKQASATSDVVQTLAQDAFSVLAENGRFSDFMWCWDGVPEPGKSTPEPPPHGPRKGSGD